MGHLNYLDFIAIAIYVASMLIVGWWYSRRQKSTEEYFLAGRSGHPFLVGISLIASLMSTISYLSVPGEVIANGTGMVWSILHTPFTFLIVAYFIIPKIMKYKITSAYELLEGMFGHNIRLAGSVLFLLVRMSCMYFIVYTCAIAISTIV